MKQETVNTFSEGLNYDLNPVVTPNNVLTDAVNGTFVTFNGNELSLQNDAGNTVINVMNAGDNVPTFDSTGATTYTVGQYMAITDSTNRLRYWECVVATNQSPLTHPEFWREYIVRLTEGYYPIGVKEYGGVLYIVSGIDVVNMSTIFQSGTIYRLNQTVEAGMDQVSPVIIGDFYISLKYDNTAALSDTTSWLHAGNIIQAPSYNMIEFGSYPSPVKHFNTAGETETLNVSLQQLYNPTLISQVVFSAGENVTFSSSVSSDWITRSNIINPATDIRFYNVKLLQQLTSGYTDLTSDIDTAFIAYGSSYPHWLFDNSFHFQCPYLYKGKLAISLEIQKLQAFTALLDSIDYDLNSNLYSLTIKVDAKFINNSNSIQVSGGTNCVFITLSIGNKVLVQGIDYTISAWPTLISSTELKGNLVVSDINGTYAGQLVTYSIIPNFIYSGSSSNNADLLAKAPQYIEQSTISGSAVLLAGNYALFLKEDSTEYNNSCSATVPGYRDYNVLTLVNESGELVGLDLAVNLLGFYFIRTGYSYFMLDSQILGYFDVDSNNKAVFNSWSSTVLALSEDRKSVV